MSKAKWMCAVLCVLGLALAATAQEPAKVAGKWELSWEGRQGTMTSTLVLEQDGAKLKGTLTGGRGGEAPVTGTVKGKEVEFSVQRQTPRGEMTLTYKGTVDGDAMKGTMSGPGGRFTVEWTAKRQK